MSSEQKTPNYSSLKVFVVSTTLILLSCGAITVAVAVPLPLAADICLIGGGIAGLIYGIFWGVLENTRLQIKEADRHSADVAAAEARLEEARVSLETHWQLDARLESMERTITELRDGLSRIWKLREGLDIQVKEDCWQSLVMSFKTIRGLSELLVENRDSLIEDGKRTIWLDYAKFFMVYVLTNEENRPAVEAWFEGDMTERLQGPEFEINNDGKKVLPLISDRFELDYPGFYKRYAPRVEAWLKDSPRI